MSEPHVYVESFAVNRCLFCGKGPEAEHLAAAIEEETTESGKIKKFLRNDLLSIADMINPPDEVVRSDIRKAVQLIRLLWARSDALETWEADDGLAFALADVELKTFIGENL